MWLKLVDAVSLTLALFVAHCWKFSCFQGGFNFGSSFIQFKRDYWKRLAVIVHIRCREDRSRNFL
jgi:hypothetical protein